MIVEKNLSPRLRYDLVQLEGNSCSSTSLKKVRQARLIGVSNESPRSPPGQGGGFTTFLCSRGRAFAIHLCPGVGAFAIDINSRNFQVLTIFIFISSSRFYSKVPPFIELGF